MKLHKKILITSGIVSLFLLSLSSPTFAANRYWVGADNTTTNSTASWSTSSGGASGASIPGASDVAIFDGGRTTNANIDAAMNVVALSVTSGYSGTITLSSTIRVTSNVTPISVLGGTFIGTGTTTVAGYGGAFNCNQAYPGVVVINTGSIAYTVTISSGCSIDLGANASTIGSIINNGTITVGSGTWNLSSWMTNKSIITVNGSLTVSDQSSITNASGATFTVATGGSWTMPGTVTNSGTINHNGSTWSFLLNGGGAPRLTNNAGGVINYSGAILSIGNSGSVTQNGTFNFSGTTSFSEISNHSLTCRGVYPGTVSYNISSNTYLMTIAGSCTVTLTPGATFIGTLVNYATTTYSGTTLGFSVSISNYGNISFPNLTSWPSTIGFTNQTSTSTFSAPSLTGAVTFSSITNSGTVTIGSGNAVLSVSGSLTNNTGATFNYTNPQLNIYRDFTQNGTFDSASSVTVRFLGTQSSAMSCSNFPGNVRLLKSLSSGGDSFTLNSGCTTNFDASVTWTTVYGGIFISGTANVVGSTTWRFSQNYNSGLNINAGGILDFTNGQYIYIATSLTQNGTYNFSGVTVFNSTAYSPNIVCTGTIPGRVRVSKGGDHYGQSFSLSSKCTITAEDNAVWSFPSHHIWNVNGIINVPNGITINGTYDTTSFVVNNKINILAGSFNLNYVQLVNNGSINHSGTSWAMAHGTYYSTSFTNNASGTVTYGGSGLSIDGFMTNTGTINWTGSNQTLTVSGNLSLGGTFDLAGKTILLNGAVNATLTCPVGGILGASVLQLSKAAANSLTLSGCNTINGDFITTSGILANPASPLTLSILGNVTLKSTAALGGANLTLAMNGTNKSLSLGGGILSSLAGFTFGASGQTFNYTSGTFINNYSFGSNTKYFNLLGGTFATNATFTGDDQTIYGVSTSTLAGNLTFTGTGINSISLGGNATAGTTTISQTAPGYMKLSGNSRFWNLVISAGATLDSSPDMGGTSFNLTLNNDFVKSGIFLPRAGTFIFDNTTRTKTYALSGHTFNNIGLTSADASTATTTFTGGLTFTGDLSISTYGGGAFIHTWNVATTTTFTVPGSFIMSKKGATPVFSTGVTTFNATGNNSTISIGAGVTFAAASASINLNGSGITSLLKANSTQTSGTTIINQSSGSVVLIGNSTFFHLTINPSNSIDSSPDGSTSYNTTVNGNFTNNAGSSGFVARSGTLILASTNISTNITIGGSALNNLSFIMANNCLAAGTTVSATLSDSFNIGGDLSIASTNCSTSNYTSILPSGSMTINVSGNITVTQSSTSFILGNSNLTLNMIGQSRSLTASMQLNANLNVNGDGITTISSSGMIGTGTTTINNSTGTTVLSTNSSFPNLVINPGKSISAVNGGSSYNMTITGNFVNNAGVSGFIPGSGTVTFNPNSSYLGAGNTVRIVTNNISFNNLGISCYSQGASGSTLTIVLADNINVTGNLTYSPTGSAATRNAVVSATTSISINVFGNFSYSATTVTATFGNSNITLNMQGSNSSFVVSAGTFNANVNFSGTGTTLVSKAGSTSAGTTTINQSSGGVVLNGNSIFNELILNEGTFTAGTSTATINNKLVLNNGTFNASSATTSVGADFKILSNAIFNHNNGTFNLSSSTVNQKIETEKDLTFYNLYKYVVGAYSRVLTFNSGFTFTVLGTATLKGSITANAGNTNYYKLYLNPTLNGISWNFDPRGTRDFNNLAPWYSNNINATPISNNGLPLSSASSTGDSNTIPTTGCTGAVPFCDRGYNSNWLFGSGLFAYWCGTGGNNNVSNNINWKTATNCGGSGATLSSGYQLYFDMPTSTNAIFDSSSQSSYAGVNISSAYRGTITQACPMDLKTSGYVQNGGTFVGSSDSFVTKSFTLGGGTTTAPTVMNVNGGFFMTGGIFLASTTLNVTGSFTDNKVGSAFTAGSGTVNLTGGSQTVTSVGTTTFYNLARPPGGGTLTFSAGKVFQVSNRLTLSGAQGYLLGLRSSLPGTYWNILPSNTESNRSLGFLDVKDSFNLSSTAMNAGGSSIDSGHNENWVFSIPGVTMSTYGSQLATTTIPENNGVASLMLGGAFTAIRSSSGADVAINSIKFTYTGSLPISYLKNVTLYYNTGQCLSGWTNSGLTSAGTIGQVNSTYTFASLNVPVGFSTTTCLYLGYDIQGAVSESLVGSTINFKIHNPTIDVVLDSGLATPSWFLDIPVNTKIDGASFGITDFLSLVTSDQQKNPTVFSLKNGALWKTEGLSGTPVRLTPAEMVASIPSGETSVFTVRQVPDSSPPIYRAIIEFTLSRVDPKNPSGQRYSKTFNMTATMKASPQ